MKTLENKVAIVTGASREIGAEMAFELAQAGACVVVAHYGESALAQQTAQRIHNAGGQAIVVESDGRQVSDCSDLVDAAVQAFGRVDILAANAGITRFGNFLTFDEATYDEVMDTNLKGSFFLAQAAARQMQAQGKTESGYRMVFSSSVAGQKGIPTVTAYGITKLGVTYLAKSLAAALAPYGVTANALIIGPVVNARNLATTPNYAENFGRVLPIGRVLYPSDVAAALMYLVSP
ncbi:MAG: SDR family NAD(P)-dependent oxidoreductase, partial [Anaerolineae bacterium]|nr:SDR family NAD(P)-dependent oxidoreductase [Anaerolineae bacterium]